MLVSVIIPIYNVEQYVKRCLFSVLDQSYSNIEIILVNDSTPDNSMVVVNELLLLRPEENRVKIINHSQNQGLSVARNSGIEVATGDYIYFLDSDDEITLSCLEILLRKSNGEDLVVGGFLKGDGSSYFVNKENKYEGEEVLEAYFTGKIYDMACNKLVKRDFLIKNKLYFKPRLIHEDILWTYQCCIVAQSVKVIEDSTYFYYILDGSLNTNFTGRNLKSLEEIYNEIRKDIILKKKENNALINLFLMNFIIGIKIRAVRSSITFKDFKNVVFEPIEFKYESLKSKFKYRLLKSPCIFQYCLIKFLNNILPS